MQLREGRLPRVAGTPYNDAVEIPHDIRAVSDDVVRHVYDGLNENEHMSFN